VSEGGSVEGEGGAEGPRDVWPRVGGQRVRIGGVQSRRTCKERFMRSDSVRGFVRMKLHVPAISLEGWRCR